MYEAMELTLMLKALASSQLAFELRSNLVEELVDSSNAIAGRDTTHAPMSGIHRHSVQRSSFGNRLSVCGSVGDEDASIGLMSKWAVSRCRE